MRVTGILELRFRYESRARVIMGGLVILFVAKYEFDREKISGGGDECGSVRGLVL